MSLPGLVGSVLAGELWEGTGLKGSDTMIGADIVNFVVASDALDDLNLGSTMIFTPQYTLH